MKKQWKFWEIAIFHRKWLLQAKKSSNLKERKLRQERRKVSLQHNWNAFRHLALNNLKTVPHTHPSPSWGGSSRCNTPVLRTNAGGERFQTTLKPQISHFCAILRWEPLHFSHPTVFCHPELGSGWQGRENHASGGRIWAYLLQSGDSETSSEWRCAFFVTLNLIQGRKISAYRLSACNSALRKVIGRMEMN